MDYTAEDEVIIKEKWDDLLLSCTKICKNDEDWNFIKRAFFLAKEAHQGVRRRSGEPYLCLLYTSHGDPDLLAREVLAQVVGKPLCGSAYRVDVHAVGTHALSLIHI